MSKMMFVVAVLVGLVGTQVVAEARGGAGGGFGGGSGSSMRTLRVGDSMGRGDMVRTREQERLRDCDLAADGTRAGSGDQLRTKQQDRLRDPSLHTDVPADVVAETPAE